MIIALLLTVATLFVYWQVQHQDFTNFDEGFYVTENPTVLQGLTGNGLKYAFTESKSGYWHPLTWLSLMGDSQLFRSNAGGYHWTSLIIHLVNTLLLFFLLSALTKAPWRSGFAAALFAFHPLHVEAVVWIAARKDVLSGFFWMLALGAYASYVKKPTGRRYSLVLLAYVLGLMAKPTVVPLPAVLLLLDYWPLRSSRPPGNITESTFLGRVGDGRGGSQTSTLFLLLEKIPLALLALVIGLISIYLQGDADSLVSLQSTSLFDRLPHALVSYLDYLIKMFWPINLAAFYPYQAHLSPWRVWTAAGLLLAISWLAFSTRKKHPYLIVGWAWYLVTLLPVIGLVNVWTHDVADRYTYLPLVGIFIMLAWGIPKLVSSWSGHRAILLFTACACLTVLLALARQQVAHWQDSYTLWSHALNVTKDNPVAHNNLGFFLANKGRKQEAEAHYRQAIRLLPDNYVSYNNLGKLLAEQGRQQEAYAQFGQALLLNPAYEDAHKNWGIYLARQGRYNEARDHFLAAAHLKPGEAEFQFYVGLVYVQLGNDSLARQYFLRCLGLDGSFGKAKEMLEHLDRSLKIKHHETP